MRLSEFWRLMDQEFGSAYARSLSRSHHLHAVGDLTAEAALEAGLAPRTVWEAMCEDFDVPPERRYLHDPRQRRGAGGGSR